MDDHLNQSFLINEAFLASRRMIPAEKFAEAIRENESFSELIQKIRVTGKNQKPHHDV